MLKKLVRLRQERRNQKTFALQLIARLAYRSRAVITGQSNAVLPHGRALLNACSIVLLTGIPLAQANETEARNIAEEMNTLVVASDKSDSSVALAADDDSANNKKLNSDNQGASQAAHKSTKSDTETPDLDTPDSDATQTVALAEDANIPKAKSVDLAQPISKDELNAVEEPAASPEEASSETSVNTSQEASETNTQSDAVDSSSSSESTTQESSEASAETAQEQSTVDTETAEVSSQEIPSPETPSQESSQEQEPVAPAIIEPDSLLILGTKVPPSTSTRLAWSPDQSFEGLSLPTPVLVVNGAKNGPTLCLTAAVHGDELNGIEIVRRVMYGLDPEELNGAIIGVPIVNLQGFRRSSRYLADRRDLNRYFPGNPSGSSASRIAHSFFNRVISHCDALVDLHTGSFDRINLPQLRADLRNKEIAKLTHNFGATVVLHSTGAEGTLRRAAAESGIPAVTLEAGGPIRLEEDSVSHGVAGIQTLLNSMGMIKKFSFWGKPEPVYYESSWIRVNYGGILFSKVELGKKIKAGDVLGTVTDPITNVRHEITSPHEGRVIGMALNQVMLPGFAAYHIGIAAKDETKVVPPEEDEPQQLIDSDLSKVDNKEQDKPKENPQEAVTTDKKVQEEATLSDSKKAPAGPSVESEE
ncbi:succinylglutamate desuccinylase [Pseudomaricurvus sp.]|uniref:succinylglutamate desuccinylase/aspartoacylase family protein n=1 Tax=Pseudomaricurvus sp. TaxID=2004510 RepID=UPI003F6D26F1